MKRNKSSGIYIIKNTIDDRFYVGSAKCFHIRYGDHKRESAKNRHHCKPLQNFINKYGFDKLYFEILEECEIEQLIKREQHYLDTLKPSFNVCKTAGSVLGRKHSDETKRKIGAKHLGKKGIKQTEEHKAKLLHYHKTKVVTDETRARMSKSLKGKKGKPLSQEHKLKLLKANKERVYEPHSDETKRKISNTKKRNNELNKIKEYLIV